MATTTDVASPAGLQRSALATLDGVLLVTLDTSGRVTSASGRALSCVAPEGRQIVGRLYSIAFSDAPEIETGLRHALTGHASVRLHVAGANALEVRCGPLFDAAGRVRGAVALGTDAKALIGAEERLGRRASAEEHPGTVARDAFERTVDRLARAAVPGDSVAVLAVGLRDLRLVNAALGRSAGDELLRRLGEAARASVPALDRVARIGGSRFGLVLSGLPRVGEAAAREAAAALLDRLDAVLELASAEVRPSVAVGVSLAPVHAADGETLVRLAEQAQRGARTDPRHPICLAVQGDDGAALEELRMANRLAGAADRGELELLYQPIFNLATGKPYGVETFLRWVDPDRGVVAPGRFIPLAERTGAIRDLTKWVLDELCRRGGGWSAEGTDLQLHMNISVLDLHDAELGEQIQAATRRHGLLPSRLTLELTESAAILDTGSALHALHRLRADGVRIALDNFGAAHSSFARVREVPADVLKIDRSLVCETPDGTAARVMIEGALRIAAALGMQTVAQGIETDDQRRYLVEAGCPLGQGFALARPGPRDDRGPDG